MESIGEASNNNNNKLQLLSTETCFSKVLLIITCQCSCFNTRSLNWWSLFISHEILVFASWSEFHSQAWRGWGLFHLFCSQQGDLPVLNLTHVSITFWMKGSKTKQKMNIRLNKEVKGGSCSANGLGAVCVCASAEWHLVLSMRLSNSGNVSLIISVRWWSEASERCQHKGRWVRMASVKIYVKNVGTPGIIVCLYLRTVLVWMTELNKTMSI